MKTRKLSRNQRIAAGVSVVGAIVLGIYAASTFTANSQPVGYLGGIALSTDFLMQDATKNPTGGGFMYRPWFENGAYQGDLIEYTLSASGDASTTIDLSTIPPTNTGTQENWSARLQFDAMEAADPTWWSVSRKIITNNGGQVPFRWGKLSTDQQTALDSVNVGQSDSTLLDFIRGDRTNEGPTYRTRWNVLGDIIHSTPVYVGKPREQYTFDNYPTYKSDNASRAGRVYVGSNDGMLHAFDADTGDEVWAYVPSMVIGNLGTLSVAPYSPNHHYFVDGPMTAGDAYFGGAWHTVLVGTLGAGGKGVFALDVTDPDLSAEDAASGSDAKILWELTATGDDDFGDSYSKPVIARLTDGKWYAVFGNGYNSVNGLAKLYIVDLETGAIHKKIDTGSGSAGSPNGLSSPVLVDNGFFEAAYAYAGDIDGHVWKFDLSTETVALSGAPLFSTGSSLKPITTRPDIVSHLSGYLVYFGTGRILSSNDYGTDFNGDNVPDIQTVYAIYDKGSAVDESSLVTQTLSNDTAYSGNGNVRTVRTLSNNTIDWTTKFGWKINLSAGERLVTDPVVRAKRVQMITTIPNSTSTVNWIFEPHYVTGGPPEQTVFDLNVDGVLDNNDNIDADGDGLLTSAVDVVAAWKLGDGVASGPIHAIIDQTSSGTIDTVFYNNLTPPVELVCTDDCPFLMGDLDVMTDSPYGPKYETQGIDGVQTTTGGLGGHPNGHQHAYDKVHGVVYVDLLGAEALSNDPPDDDSVSRYGKMEPRRNLTSLRYEDNLGTAKQRLNSAEEAYTVSGGPTVLSGSTEFIVVLTNADLSTGGTIKIGAKEWPVQTYQDMVATKLLALNGAAATSANFKDNEGVSLVFTLDQIKAAGTLRISFDNRSIMNGKVHPTMPMCVSGDKEPYNYTQPSNSNVHITKVPSGASKDPNATDGYRWRNGALTVQLLKANGYVLQPKNNGLSGANLKQWLPQKKSGSTYTVVGGVYAKKFSDVINGGTSTQTITELEGANESGLLYEASMFWHFGDLNVLRNGGQQNRCYGSSNWQAAKNIELGGLTLGEYNKLLNGLTDTSAELLAYEAAWEEAYLCKNDPNCSEAKLDEYIKLLNAAIDPIADYVKMRGYAPGHIPDQHLLQIDKQLGESADSTDEASTDTTLVGETGNSVGPNYRPGRRTWIDISPE